MMASILNNHLCYPQPIQRICLKRSHIVAKAAELPPAAAITGRQLLESGAIKSIQPNKASQAILQDNFLLLDIRPQWEWEKASVAGSIHVPLFIADPNNTALTFLKKWIHLGYIGIWTGQKFTTINPNFLTQVENAIPDKGTNILVACGEGLRSKMAISKLHGGGYMNLGWLAGGFNRSNEDDFAPVIGPEKLQYATIGGVSYFFLKLLLILQRNQ